MFHRSIDWLPVEYISKEMMERALDSRFVHIGLLSDSSSHLEDNIIIINHETVRTRAFLKVLSRSNLSNEFDIGSIKLPKKSTFPIP